MKEKKGKKKNMSNKSPAYFFINDQAKQYEFSDFVRIASTPHGMILYFGRFDPEKKEFGIYQSIILPHRVANSLSEIITGHFSELIERGLITKVSEEND